MRAGPAEVRQLVERRADGAPRVEHVVHDAQRRAVDLQRQFGLADDRTRADRLQVVAIERDVEGAARHGDLFPGVDDGGDAIGQLNAATLDADEHQGVGAVGTFDNFMGHASHGALERTGVEYDRRCDWHTR